MRLRRLLSATVRFTVAVLTSAFALTAWAPPASSWGIQSEGNKWYVKEGNTKIEMPDQKTAESVADKFNKIDEKADKRAEKGDKKDGKDTGGSKK